MGSNDACRSHGERRWTDGNWIHVRRPGRGRIDSGEAGFPDGGKGRAPNCELLGSNAARDSELGAPGNLLASPCTTWLSSFSNAATFTVAWRVMPVCKRFSR